jgi:hypothetical protein
VGAGALGELNHMRLNRSRPLVVSALEMPTSSNRVSHRRRWHAAASLLNRGEPFNSTAFCVTIEKVTFSLTDKGRSLWRAPNSIARGSLGGFCGGHIGIVSVDRFTEPADFNGQKVSQVTFMVRANYDDWTKAPPLQKVFQDELSHTAATSQTLPLALMNDSWAVATNQPAAQQQ